MRYKSEAAELTKLLALELLLLRLLRESSLPLEDRELPRAMPDDLLRLRLRPRWRRCRLDTTVARGTEVIRASWESSWTI